MAAVEYKLIAMNGSGVIDSAFTLRFADDATAMAHARALGHAERVEVWAGKRRVGLVPPATVPRAPGLRTRQGDG